MSILGATIVEIVNGEDGNQPTILIEGIDGKRYLITATPERRFIITEVQT